jgi:hypothetical protein
MLARQSPQQVRVAPRRAPGRGLAGGAVALFMLGLALWLPAHARASACDTWTNSAGGNWSEGANWSAGAPPGESEEACITEPGTYTVTISGAQERVAALTLGAGSGTQTLAVESDCSGSASLATSAGLTVNAGGAILLTNGATCANAVSLAGPVTNGGMITAASGANGGERRLEGNIANKGTLKIESATSVAGSSTLVTNKGVLEVAAGTQLYVSGGDTLDNTAGGAITTTGSGNVLIAAGATIDQGAGTTSGQVIVSEGTLNYTGGGASTIKVRGAANHLSGNIAAGQMLALEGCAGGSSATITSASGFTNAGTIDLGNTGGCGGAGQNEARIALGEGVLVNNGTINAEAGAGTRVIRGSLANRAKLAVNENTLLEGSAQTLTNEGGIRVAEGKQLSLSMGDTLANASGSIVTTGSGSVLVPSGGTLIEGAGAITGQVIVEEGTVHYTDVGASTVVVRGYPSHLVGNIAADQRLQLEGCAGHGNAAGLAAAGSFTNAGTIVLTSAPGCSGTGQNEARIELGQGTLTSSGAIVVEPGGGREIKGNLDNTKLLSLAAGATLAVAGSYVQGKTARFSKTIAGAGSFGALAAGGTATLQGGTLSIVQGFKAAQGETFPILTSSALSGRFKKVAGARIAKSKPKLKYTPAYSSTGVTLQVT